MSKKEKEYQKMGWFRRELVNNKPFFIFVERFIGGWLLAFRGSECKSVFWSTILMFGGITMAMYPLIKLKNND